MGWGGRSLHYIKNIPFFLLICLNNKMLFFFGDSLIRASMKVASYHWKQIHIHMQKKKKIHNKFSFTFCLPCPLWKLILRAVHKVSEIEFTAIKACADYEWWNIIYKLCASWKIFLICNLKYGKQLRKKLLFDCIAQECQLKDARMHL